MFHDLKKLLNVKQALKRAWKKTSAKDASQFAEILFRHQIVVTMQRLLQESIVFTAPDTCGCSFSGGLIRLLHAPWGRQGSFAGIHRHGDILFLRRGTNRCFPG